MAIKRILMVFMGMVLMDTAVFGQQPVSVFIVAGQSNTDGRVPVKDLPESITKDSYKHCLWSYGSGTHAADGTFTPFWPKTYVAKNPQRWGYDAIVYDLLGKSLQQDFYVIKESLGGTAISPKAPKSTQHMYWSADEAFLDSVQSASVGGRSLLKALCDHIDRCIDGQLSQLKQGYEFKALLWHQGESDVKQAKVYQKNLEAVIAYVRQHLVSKTGDKRYATLPVILGGISHQSRGYSSTLEPQQMAVAEQDANVYYVDVFDAPLLSDNLHFNRQGAELLGKKVYNQLVALGMAGAKAKPVAVQQKYRKIDLRPDGSAYLLAYLPSSKIQVSGSKLSTVNCQLSTAIVACPGGGYDHLASATEGTAWADFYNGQGVAYFVLKYRMPKGDRTLPIADAEAAIKMVRDSAKVWNIDPQKVGIMGSSAGGHLASTIATHSDKSVASNFQILFYPVITFGEGCHKGSRKNFLGKDEKKAEVVKQYSNELQVKKGVTPPAIILLADDDRSVPPATNGKAYYEALQREGIPSELHAFPKGGHGFGFKKFAHHDEVLEALRTWLERLKTNVFLTTKCRFGDVKTTY